MGRAFSELPGGLHTPLNLVRPARAGAHPACQICGKVQTCRHRKSQRVTGKQDTKKVLRAQPGTAPGMTPGAAKEVAEQ